MKHMHTFGCPVFALQNALASSNQLPWFSPCVPWAQFGPGPMHTRKVYLDLNLITGCVSPQYCCCFEDFFKTTHYSASDNSGTICLQELANWDRATTILSKVSRPKQHSIISLEMLSEEVAHTVSKPTFKPPMYDVTSDDNIMSDGDLHVSENSCPSQWTQASHTNEGVTPVEPTVTAGTSQRGRVHTMSRRMAESVSQQDFYEDHSMHYMASQATARETGKDLFHYSHLQLQKQMRNPIAFHVELMGDSM